MNQKEKYGLYSARRLVLDVRGKRTLETQSTVLDYSITRRLLHLGNRLAETKSEWANNGSDR
jgi:hypothetical protein